MKRWADKNCPSRTFDLAVLHFFEQLSPGLIPELLHHDSNPIFVPFLDSRHIKKMADLFRRKSSTYQQCFLERLPKLMRLTPSKKTPLYNGAIECRLFEFKMVAGSNRR